MHYNFVDSADGHFTIDEMEGVVSLARPLDREIRDSYILTVRAIDQGVPPLSSTTQLTVTVSGKRHMLLCLLSTLYSIFSFLFFYNLDFLWEFMD